MSGSELLYETRGRMAIITLNRPERFNALNVRLRLELTRAWERFKASEDEWVAILTGAGDKAFCAGADLRERASRSVAEEYKAREEAGLSVYGSHYAFEVFKPTIAAVNGYALAGGFILCQSCSLVVAAEHAEFGITEPRWNLKGAVAAPLSRAISMKHLIELTIVPARVSAKRAYEMGFVNWVVPKEKLMDKALEVANLILENAPASVASFIEMYHRTYGMSIQDAITIGGHIQKHLDAMEDTIEGPKAFTEKRKPQWKNR